ncbi:MAG: hypothetical protein COX01_05515 [Verrucomicrobia bacterium CG22_combo_CG10-13_8_21_14_all_43_17]|nr:MAG: hypothetical protein COX01_05515 [Verrucomicrobia bacterium CG22_combo_CG10-13_8_21_14_all_43_17]
MFLSIVLLRLKSKFNISTLVKKCKKIKPNFLILSYFYTHSVVKMNNERKYAFIQEKNNIK